MQAIQVKQFGEPDVLKLESNVPIPHPGDNQVLVKVKSVGVNPVDIHIRAGELSVAGLTLPYTPGSDCAGTVEKVGKNVTDFKAGDRVYTCQTVSGSYAQYALANDYVTARLPPNVSFDEGAALGIPFNTAYKALAIKGNVRPGETVLIQGAARGWTGIPCCQMAQAMGLTVLGTAGTKEGLELVKENGANLVFNHQDADYVDKIKAATGGKGPDVIIEMYGSISIENDLKMIRERTGRIMIIGSQDKIEVTPRVVVRKEVTIKAVLTLTNEKDEWKEYHSYLYNGLKNGWLKPVIGEKFPLDKASDAHIAQMNAGPVKYGKIILTV